MARQAQNLIIEVTMNEGYQSAHVKWSELGNGTHEHHFYNTPEGRASFSSWVDSVLSGDAVILTSQEESQLTNLRSSFQVL